ncbi:MAG TPA: aminoglycoside phosphotransferase family protein [Gammaproteobacteria bacterium]|nr:aminoglycoside phosphotransferase family protein [Gammaproteobacteria bacterium]
MSPFSSLTPEAACAALGAARLRLRPSDVSVERREERWLVRVPGPRVAWFAASPNGRVALATERRVLRLLADRCGFTAPRVLYESPSGDFEVRSLVVGSADSAETYARMRRDPAAASRFGAGVGAILAELHSKIAAAEVADWLPARPSWPEPGAWIAERLPSVVADADLCARAADVIAAYESEPVATHDRVLAHTDVGVHNVVVAPSSLEVLGLFDYDGAACADRHHDFRYLVLDFEAKAFDAAVAAYEPVTGCTISRERVLLYNAACAISYLAFRAGHAPDEPWCGRTLAQDLQWSSRAIERVVGSRRA